VFAGIAPAGAPAFIAAQLLAAPVALVVSRWLSPKPVRVG
jgi:hypothetical protein